MQRLFVAIEIPSEIQNAMSDTIRTLRDTGADVRWEAAAKLHITLKFLGNAEEHRVPEIVTALKEIARIKDPFTVQYATLGRFPPKSDPRIIWIGVRRGEESLTSLAGVVDESMALLRVDKEDRPFHPHVTIGRVKGRRNIGDLLRTMESITFESQPTHVTHIALIKSELKPSGSVYTKLQSFELIARSHKG